MVEGRNIQISFNSLNNCGGRFRCSLLRICSADDSLTILLDCGLPNNSSANNSYELLRSSEIDVCLLTSASSKCINTIPYLQKRLKYLCTEPVKRMAELCLCADIMNRENMKFNSFNDTQSISMRHGPVSSFDYKNTIKKSHDIMSLEEAICLVNNDMRPLQFGQEIELPLRPNNISGNITENNNISYIDNNNNLRDNHKVKRNVIISPYCSGTDLGSAFWVITIDMYRIVYAPELQISRDSFFSHSDIDAIGYPTIFITDTFPSKILCINPNDIVGQLQKEKSLYDKITDLSKLSEENCLKSSKENNAPLFILGESTKVSLPKTKELRIKTSIFSDLINSKEDFLRCIVTCLRDGGTTLLPIAPCLSGRALSLLSILENNWIEDPRLQIFPIIVIGPLVDMALLQARTRIEFLSPDLRKILDKSAGFEMHPLIFRNIHFYGSLLATKNSKYHGHNVFSKDSPKIIIATGEALTNEAQEVFSIHSSDPKFLTIFTTLQEGSEFSLFYKILQKIISERSDFSFGTLHDDKYSFDIIEEYIAKMKYSDEALREYYKNQSEKMAAQEITIKHHKKVTEREERIRQETELLQNHSSEISTEPIQRKIGEILTDSTSRVKGLMSIAIDSRNQASIHSISDHNDPEFFVPGIYESRTAICNEKQFGTFGKRCLKVQDDDNIDRSEYGANITEDMISEWYKHTDVENIAAKRSRTEEMSTGRMNPIKQMKADTINTIKSDVKTQNMKVDISTERSEGGEHLRGNNVFIGDTEIDWRADMRIKFGEPIMAEKRERILKIRCRIVLMKPGNIFDGISTEYQRMSLIGKMKPEHLILIPCTSDSGYKSTYRSSGAREIHLHKADIILYGDHVKCWIGSDILKSQSNYSLSRISSVATTSILSPLRANQCIEKRREMRIFSLNSRLVSRLSTDVLSEDINSDVRLLVLPNIQSENENENESFDLIEGIENSKICKMEKKRKKNKRNSLLLSDGFVQLRDLKKSIESSSREVAMGITQEKGSQFPTSRLIIREKIAGENNDTLINNENIEEVVVDTFKEGGERIRISGDLGDSFYALRNALYQSFTMLQ